MKGIITFFFALFFFNFNSQKIDKKYYLLGLTDNYMGRVYELKNPDYKGFIVKFPKGEFSQMNRIEQISGLKFSMMNLEGFGEWFILKSTNFEKEINRFYSFSKIRGSENHKGILNIKKVLKGSENQLISYLLGSFLIHGKMLNESEFGEEYPVYEISVANSESQFDVLKAILMKQSYVLKEEVLYSTPRIYRIQFTPDHQLKNLLDVELKFKK